MILFSKKNSKGIIVATNINDDNLLKNKKVKEFETSSGILMISTDDTDLLKSSKVFKRVGESCALAFDLMHKNFIDQFTAHSHTLKKIQGQLSQKIEGLLSSQLYALAKSYDEQKQVVLEKITTNPEEVADNLIYLHKRIFELGAHMSSFEILHMGEQLSLDVKKHNLRRLLINVLHGFEDRLEESLVKPSFKFEDEDAEECKMEADYKTINAAFYNFFDNAVKYAKPDSQIRFYLKNDDNEFKLIITMKSLRIDQDELEKVFELGYRSRNCINKDGSGIGMFVVNKALQLNKFNIEIEPEYSNMERYNDHQYILNKFIISKIK